MADTRTVRDTGAEAEAGPAGKQAGRIAYALVAGLILLYGVVLLRTAWLCDDCFITFRTVGNFVSGYGLVWNIAERVQTYTHPLWMFLLSGLFVISGGDISNSTIFGSIALSLAAVLLYAFGIARTAWHATLGLTVLIFSKAFVDYSTSGLENPLSYLLVAWFLWLYLKSEGRETSTPADDAGVAAGEHRSTPASANRSRLLGLSLLASLILLTRMDLALLIGPALLHAFWRSHGLRAVGTVFLGLLPFLAWEVFSVIYYGFPFPNTAYAKLSTGIPAADLAWQGLSYFANSLRMDPLTLPAIACAILAAVVSRRSRHLAIAAGIVLYLLYVVKIGGDFMSGRFFAVPLLAGLAVLGTLSIRGWMATVLWSLAMLASVGLGLKAPNPPMLTGSMYGHVGDGLVDPHGIADERGWYYIYTGLLRGTRHRTPDGRILAHEALSLAKEARERKIKVTTSRNTIGMFGYHIGPEVHIVDLFALADPLLARLAVTPGAKWRIGHFEREIPAGYLNSLETGRNEIVDPAVHDLYDKILLITRGPLFTRQRWAAIWQVNVSGFDVPASQPTSQPAPGAAGR